MRIQLGQILINQTKKYLVPCLKVYGAEFERRITAVWKVGFGIGDTITIKSNILFEKHIFILCDTKANVTSFTQFLDWLKEQDMYEEDYAYDNLNDGCLHMIVIKLPEECYHSYETFKKSEFSNMYSKEDLERFFDKNSDVVKVLIKDHNYKIEFSRFIKEMYEVDIPAHEITDDFELDFPISEHEEIFNKEII